MNHSAAPSIAVDLIYREPNYLQKKVFGAVAKPETQRPSTAYPRSNPVNREG